MRIFESEIEYRLSLVLDNDEQDRFMNAFKHGTPITIPELGWKSFYIEKIERYNFDNLPENSFHVIASQSKPDRFDLKSGMRIVNM